MNLIAALAFTLLFAVSGFAQGGGKAEPSRISFAASSPSAVVTGRLASGVEMEYIFSALKGRRATVTNSFPTAFDVRIFSAESGLETEFDNSRVFSIVLPADGEYMMFVRRKQTADRRPRRYKIALKLSE